MRVAHGINIAQLRAFVAVVDEGGFGSAAAALGITQSAVSHAVAALERTVGTQVIHRGGGASPTPFGQRMLDHARAALAATEAIGDSPRSSSHRMPGAVARAARALADRVPARLCTGVRR
jgi:DNA-binding transcriptional LysR family regulator